MLEKKKNRENDLIKDKSEKVIGKKLSRAQNNLLKHKHCYLVYVDFPRIS
jgi:hypothetical protein